MGTIICIIQLLLVNLCCYKILRQTSNKARFYLYLVLSIIFTFDYLSFLTGISLYELLITLNAALSAFVLIYLITSLTRLRMLRGVIDIIVMSIVLPPLVVMKCMHVKSLTQDVFLTIMQTNLSEAYLFLTQYVGTLWIILSFLFLCTISIFVNIRKQASTYSRVWWIVILLLLISIISFYKCSSTHQISLDFDAYKRKTAYLRRDKNADYSVFTSMKRDSLTCVVVIGESLTRDCMSAYGYDTKTTPKIDKLISDSVLLRFTQSFSPDIYTVICVPRIMTSEHSDCNNINYLLVDLFKKNNAGCYWFSNQSSGGIHEAASSSLAEHADNSIFAEQLSGYDDSLVPYLHNAMQENNPRKLIVLHLAGSHAPAKSNYPPHAPEYRISTKPKGSAMYDYENSVAFNDKVIHDIVETIGNSKNTILVYTSDHGDKAGSNRLYDNFDYKMVHIPFLFYASPDLHKEDFYQNMKHHLDCYWSNEYVFNLVCGIAGITNKDILKPKYDISSSLYEVTKDDIILCDGRFPLK